MIFGIKLDFQSYFNYATEFALKFRLVFASVFSCGNFEGNVDLALEERTEHS